jgi:hypothetical protein
MWDLTFIECSMIVRFGSSEQYCEYSLQEFFVFAFRHVMWFVKVSMYHEHTNLAISRYNFVGVAILNLLQSHGYGAYSALVMVLVLVRELGIQ